MDFSDTITTKKMAEIMSVSRQYVCKLAQKENWPYKPGPRKAKLFIISKLPDAYRAVIYTHRDKKSPQREVYFTPEFRKAYWAMADILRSVEGETKKQMLKNIEALLQLLSD